MALVAAGEPTAVIHERLGITENTIKSHLTRIYKKTGSRNRVQAVRHYLDRRPEPTPSNTPQPVPPNANPHRGEQHDTKLIERQAHEIQARLTELAPAVSEAKRLQTALDALRAIQRR